MISFTFSKVYKGREHIAVVTADHVPMALILLRQAFEGVPIEAKDLVPLPTHHRHVRVMKNPKLELPKLPPQGLYLPEHSKDHQP